MFFSPFCLVSVVGLCCFDFSFPALLGLLRVPFYARNVKFSVFPCFCCGSVFLLFWLSCWELWFYCFKFSYLKMSNPSVKAGVSPACPPSASGDASVAALGSSPSVQGAPPPSAKPWNKLFERKKSNSSLKFFPPPARKYPNRAIVAPPKEIAEVGAKRWENCAVGFFLGRRVPFPLVKRYADRMWTSLGLEEITSNGQGMFILKFKNGDDLMKVIEEGPWSMVGQPFFVQKWTRNLTMATENVKKVAVWVKIFSLPLEFWNPKGLSYVVSGLGKPLYPDSVTKKGSRLEFARICVEMGVENNFPDFIDLLLPNGESVELRVEYSWRPIKCSICSLYGHVKEECKNNVEKKENIKPILARTTNESGKWELPKKSDKGKEVKERRMQGENPSREPIKPKKDKSPEEKELLNRLAHVTEEVTLGKEGKVVPVSKLKEPCTIPKGKEVISLNDQECPKQAAKEYNPSCTTQKPRSLGIVIKEGNEQGQLTDDDDLDSPQIIPFDKLLRLDEKDVDGASSSRLSKQQRKKLAKKRRNSLPSNSAND